MDRNWRAGLIVLLIGAVAGCGGNASTEPAGLALPDNPAAQAAYHFLDAVLKGDTQRASGCLSPLAIQRIVESGKQFAPPGIETASFRIGEVRQPTDEQALVQCLLTDSSSAGQQRRGSEEIRCLMRFVDGQWRVSGIAYIPGPNKPPVVLDFENPQSDFLPPQNMAAASDDAPTHESPEQTSPAKTAQDPAYSGYPGLR